MPDPIVIGLFVAAAIALLVFGLCRAAGRSDASTEASMARDQATITTAPPSVQRGEVPQYAREAIQRSLDAGKRIAAAERRDPSIGRDQAVRERRTRLKGLRQRPTQRQRRITIGPGVELVGDTSGPNEAGQKRVVLGVRPSLAEARAWAREILTVPGQPIRVIYFHDLALDCYRGWMRQEDVA